MGDILWCCHVRGPDEVHAAPDYATALKWADMFNGWSDQANASFAAKHPDADPANAPKASAVPAPWPWSAEDHAQSLPKAIKNMTPRGATAPDGEGG